MKTMANKVIAVLYNQLADNAFPVLTTTSSGRFLGTGKTYV
jgi:hypothetical protein